ncbi:uncharacterized protein LOC141900007 [Tubulanus polymorphus]|uniref:uncharacterized protein LOC141900007 n=1 Tax=Tubulanus polymorphus TaxID=672921 RepID=UPI003DA2FA62
MAAQTCPNIIAIPVEKSIWENADPMWIGIAAAIGIVVGVISAIFCAKCLFDSLAKRKRQKDAEKAEAKKPCTCAGLCTGECQAEVEAKEKQGQNEKNKLGRQSSSASSKLLLANVDMDGVPRKRLSRKKSKLLRGDRKPDGEPETSDAALMIDALENQDDSLDETAANRPGRRGLADALLQPNGDAMNLELTSQDLDSVWMLERELRDDRIITFNQLIKMLLGILFKDGQISPEFYHAFSKEVRDAIIALLGELKAEQELEETILRADKDLMKNPAALEKTIEALPAKYAQKFNAKLKDQQEKVRVDMLKSSGLSEAEIDRMMAQLTASMAASERKFTAQMNTQAVTLEERILRRKQLAQLKLMQQKEQQDENVANRDAHETNLDKLITDGKLLERQKAQLLAEYDSNLQQAEEKLILGHLRAEQSLQEKLAVARERRMKQLDEKQRNEVIDVCNKSEKFANTAEFIQEFHALKEQQRQEREDTITDLDQTELQQLALLRTENKGERKELIDKENKDFINDIEVLGQLSRQEAERLLLLHQQEVQEFERLQKSEKKRMQRKMAERLAERKKRLEEESLRAQKEQQMIKDQQKNAVLKVLDIQMGMDEDAKQRILLEHDQNMQTLTNQLSISKLKQQKQLEMKLNQRKQNLANLKKQQDDAKMVQRFSNEKERAKVEADLSNKIKAEEEILEAERLQAIAELRLRLKQETDDALKEQEKQLGLLIGRLQLGQARRQAVIAKQDNTLKKLQDQIANQPSTLNISDQIIQQHYNDVSHLSDKIQASRERQEQILREKLEQKRMVKEREIDEKLQEEAYKEMDDAQKRGAGNASAILMQAMLETKHRKAREDLEHEMQIELQKQMDAFNKSMENDLAAELENQRKTFLKQLMATGKMSKPDAMKVVDGIEKDSASKRKMSDAMQLEMERTKTNLKSKADDSNGIAYQNPAFDDSDITPTRKSKSRKHKKEKPMYDVVGEDDDDF